MFNMVPCKGPSTDPKQALQLLSKGMTPNKVLSFGGTTLETK